MGLSGPPMDTVLVGSQIFPPTPPGWGLGGPKVRNGQFGGLNKMSYSDYFIVRMKFCLWALMEPKNGEKFWLKKIFDPAHFWSGRP